jgi:hypothetical protein
MAHPVELARVRFIQLGSYFYRYKYAPFKGLIMLVEKCKKDSATNHKKPN